MYERINEFDWAVIEIEDDGDESLYCLCNDEEVAHNTAQILHDDLKKKFRYEQLIISFEATING